MFSFSVIGTIASALANAVTIPNPLAWFKMNERTANTVVDSSGNGYDGTNNGATVNATGKVQDSNGVARAYDFDGTNDYIDITDSALQDLPSGDFSVSCWLKLDSLPSGTTYRICSRRNNTGGQGIIFTVDSDGHINAYSSNAGTDGSTNGNTSINDGSFHHAVMTYNSSSGEYSIFVDSVDDGTLVSAAAATPTSSTGTFKIGSSFNFTSGQFFDGKIDQFVVFNAELSQSEIDEIYNSGSGLKYTSWSGTLQTKTVAVYELDELATNVVEDFSGNAYHGTNNGASVEATAPNSGLVYSYNFDGANDYLTVSDVTPFAFANDDQFSVFCWVNFDSFAGGNMQIVGNQLAGSTFRGWKLRHLLSGQLEVSIRNTTSGSNEISVLSSSSLSTTTWYHVGFTYDGSRTAAGTKLYINGVDASSTNIDNLPDAPIQSGVGLTVGARNGGASAFVDGSIDNVKIYSTALTAAQVLAEYTGDLDASTSALLDQATTDGYTAASGTCLTALDTFISTLKSDGIWTLLDALWLPATNGDSDFACYNLKDPSTFKLTKVNSPVFTSLEGFTGDIVSAYLNTNWSPTTNGVNYQFNNASITVYARYYPGGSRYDLTFGLDGTYLEGLRSTKYWSFQGGEVSGTGLQNVNYGGITLQRISSSQIQMATRGVAYTRSSTSSALETSTLKFLSSWSGLANQDAQLSIMAAGAKLTTGQLSTFHTIMNDYMTAIGKNVY